MTQTNTFAGKLGVAFVATAMALMMVAPAQAQTAEELQAQIDALMVTIASLQAAAGATTPAAATGDAYVFTRSLTIGSQGADVTALQTYLIGAGHAIPAGATGYFGAQTASAVAAWQTANAIMPAAGYFGPVSQAKYTALMAAVTTDDSDDDSDDSDDDSASTELGGEASLTTVEVNDGDDNGDVEEGSEDLSVADINVEFSDGDAMVTRLDIALVGVNTPTENDPWDVFEEISLWVDGEKVADMDATDEDAYLDEDTGEIRFSGLEVVAMEDEEVTFTVAVTLQSSVDGAGTDADWEINAEAMRYVDADDVTTTDSDTDDLDGVATADFSVDVAGAGDDLDVESSDADPEAATIELSENDNTEAEIFAFDLSAEDSDGDISLNEIIVNVTVATTVASVGDDMDNLVQDYRLEIDGESFVAESWVGTGLTAAITFDIDGDFEVTADEMVTAVLFADLKDMATADEGSTIFAAVTNTNIDAEGAEDVVVDGGTITGETHTLRTEGVAVTYTDDTVTPEENDDTTNTDDAAVFLLKFSVDSFGDSVYLPFGATSSASLVDGVRYEIVNTNTNASVSTGTFLAALEGDSDETNSFKVSDEEAFTLSVTYDPAVAGSYKLRLVAINFAATDIALASDSQDVSALDIDTAQITISE